MALYNTAVTVLANLESGTGEAARTRLARALELAGFTVMEAVADHAVYLAEPGTESDTLPLLRTAPLPLRDAESLADHEPNCPEMP